MKQSITGRIAEIKILEQLLKSNQPELLAIYGRRRVGKTYLIKNEYRLQLVDNEIRMESQFDQV